MSVLKRQREAKKAEKAALKRERREQRLQAESESRVATKADLEGYGVMPEEDEEGNRG